MTTTDHGRRYCKFYGPRILVFAMACLVTLPLLAQTAAVDGTETISAQPNIAGDAPELTAQASQAIDKGLEFLLKTQNANGSWDSDGTGGRSVACTSLALMAFMSKAQFPGSGPHAKQLDAGKNWLLKHAKGRSDGYLGTVMYEHGLATLALSEMWGMTRDKQDDDAIQKALEKAVEVIVRSQNSGGGWTYQPQANGAQDTSCTQTVFHALASARQAGIMVPDETITKVVKYFKFAQNAETGGFAYAPYGNANVSIPCTAGGTYCAMLAGQRDSEMVAASLRYLKQQSPEVMNGGGHYYYLHYYAIQAMVQAGDEHYAEWYPLIRDALISRQKSDGSWGGGQNGAASYESSMAIIVLATPHRYIPIYQR
jgi:hypothetical protein